MNILDKIIETKKRDIQALEISYRSSEETGKTTKFIRTDLLNALKSDDISIIAEIKQKSPSEGTIRKSVDPVKVAKSYEKNGASAISVLTDSRYFGGSLETLRKIKSVVKIPVLRKDFIISELQIYESQASGADALLLIADILNYPLLHTLYTLTRNLGMQALVECHSEEGLDKTTELVPDICGINSRDLETMKTNLNWFDRSYRRLPAKSVKIAESGITQPNHVQWVKSIGYDGILIGTSLMKADDPGKKIQEMLRRK